RLSRLVLPNRCSGCLGPAELGQPVRASVSFLSLSGGVDFVRLIVPICQSCRRRNQRRSIRRLLCGMTLALSVFIGLCSLAVMARDNGLLVSTLAIAALVAPGLVLTWAAISARCLRNP